MTNTFFIIPSYLICSNFFFFFPYQASLVQTVDDLIATSYLCVTIRYEGNAMWHHRAKTTNDVRKHRPLYVTSSLRGSLTPDWQTTRAEARVLACGSDPPHWWLVDCAMIVGSRTHDSSLESRICRLLAFFSLILLRFAASETRRMHI